MLHFLVNFLYLFQIGSEHSAEDIGELCSTFQAIHISFETSNNLKSDIYIGIELINCSAHTGKIRKQEKIMNENILAHPVEDTFARPRAFQTIFYGGLVVGVLDGLFAAASTLVRGGNPVRAFQFITAGLTGSAAFEGGATTFFTGLLIHFFIALTVATIYYAASLKLPILIRRAILCGLLYGAAVYLVMYYIVMPLSAAPKLPAFSLNMFLKDIIGHALLVGLPVAMITRRFARSI